MEGRGNPQSRSARSTTWGYRYRQGLCWSSSSPERRKSNATAAGVRCPMYLPVRDPGKHVQHCTSCGVVGCALCSHAYQMAVGVGVVASCQKMSIAHCMLSKAISNLQIARQFSALYSIGSITYYPDIVCGRRCCSWLWFVHMHMPDACVYKNSTAQPESRSRHPLCHIAYTISQVISYIDIYRSSELDIDDHRYQIQGPRPPARASCVL
jgi:hypothetical protein